ncbi:SDR family NAD(P)-dependent oxidoreductase [Reyranella sp. CPCC 100927]|uniref:SDR family NAD(P)-dependent oxidoreductase n=1 Tax=Reyranella sp. CPCC 100927 TaxID=2599616 RepID=UPI0011B60F4C|nr:SDR family NAD(P)-dependent oxidoreductase [Reyranella sp. CPCC 100927]TWT15221.1 SDR family oxidoreductase [Reyranella sp. CPCC 100927]
MDLGLTGKTVVVTGGASNIGRAISQEFAREGARVAILDRDAAQTRKTVEEIKGAGGHASGYDLDVTDVDATAATIAAVERDQGAVDVLVNNVGWNGKAEFFLNLPPERWQKAFQLNLFSTLNVTRAVLPGMVDRRGGAIVSIASDAGFGEFRMADYGAMKAGVLAFTRTVALEYGRYGIRANTVAPGLVVPAPDAVGDGSLWSIDIGMGPKEVQNIESRMPLRRRSEAVDIAWSVLFLASDRARQLTGQVMSVSGGFVMPR